MDWEWFVENGVYNFDYIYCHYMTKQCSVVDWLFVDTVLSSPRLQDINLTQS